MAVSDPTGTIASPRGIVECGADRKPRKGGRTGPSPSVSIPHELLDLVAEVRPSVILVGIPYSMDGTEGEMAREARAFASALEKATGVEIVEWDERLSTARAEREIRALGLSRSRRRERGRTDEMAAALMLTDFLRSGRRGS